MAHRSRPLAVSTLLAVACSLALTISAAAQERPQGRIEVAGSNITLYTPDEAVISHDASVVDLRLVLEELGEDAILWYQHVQTLSNPFFEGRRPGTYGAQLTRDYLEYYYHLYGLEPAFGPPGDAAGESAKQGERVSYRQPFEFNRRNRTVDVKFASLAIDGDSLVEDEAYSVLGVSGTAQVTAPVTFVGYAIEEGPDGYTSFDDDTDLSGRIALVLRYAPMADGEPAWEDREYARRASIVAKFRAITERGAAGILLVNPPGYADAPEGLESAARSARFGRPLDIPVMQVTAEVADRLVREADPLGRDLETWERLADKGSITTEPLANHVKVTMQTDLMREQTSTGHPAENVGAILPGRGGLADEWIVIGGHHDHVGDGSLGGIMPSARGQMHPGADDNASGTAGVLVLAKKFADAYAAAPGDLDLRSVLFVTFDAEEMGLHGSRHLTQHLPIDADKISLCVNMDMIGRIRNDEVWVLGTGTAEGLPDLLRPHFLSSGLTVHVNARGSGRSDDANFHRIDVPALHFFSGMHEDYTRPSDRGYTVNPAGAAVLLDLIFAIAHDAATRPEMLEYSDPSEQAAGEPRRGQDRGYAPVRLGIRPGMGEESVKGILIEEVFDGTSAAEGGMQSGDVVTAWNGEVMETLGDLFEQLQKHKPGDNVKISVKRGDETVVLDVTLKAAE